MRRSRRSSSRPRARRPGSLSRRAPIRGARAVPTRPARRTPRGRPRRRSRQAPAPRARRRRRSRGTAARSRPPSPRPSPGIVIARWHTPAITPPARTCTRSHGSYGRPSSRSQRSVPLGRREGVAGLPRGANRSDELREPVVDGDPTHLGERDGAQSGATMVGMDRDLERRRPVRRVVDEAPLDHLVPAAIGQTVPVDRGRDGVRLHHHLARHLVHAEELKGRVPVVERSPAGTRDRVSSMNGGQLSSIASVKSRSSGLSSYEKNRTPVTGRSPRPGAAAGRGHAAATGSTRETTPSRRGRRASRRTPPSPIGTSAAA